MARCGLGGKAFGLGLKELGSTPSTLSWPVRRSKYMCWKGRQDSFRPGWRSPYEFDSHYIHPRRITRRGQGKVSSVTRKGKPY